MVLGENWDTDTMNEPATARAVQRMLVGRGIDGNIDRKVARVLFTGAIGNEVEMKAGAADAPTLGEVGVARANWAGSALSVPVERATSGFLENHRIRLPNGDGLICA